MKTNMIDYSDEEDEIYEITDYSNSSPLENLSSKLENKISQWVKENQEFYSHSFEYSNTLELKLEFYNQDLEDMEDEKELSSINLSSIPVFVSIGPPKHNTYLGRMQTDHEIVNFKCQTAKEISPSISKLPGLLDLFILAIGNQNSLKRKIDISPKYTYQIPSYDYKEWNQLFQEKSNSPMYLLEIGTYKDPVQMLNISCKWNSIDENSNVVNKDELSPEDASIWEIQAQRDVFPKFRLIEQLKGFISLFGDSIKLNTKKKEVESKKGQKNWKNILETNIFQTKFDTLPETEGKLPKSIKIGSLLSMFILEVSLVEDVREVQNMWKAFISILREHWETAQLLPLQDQSAYPDWQYSLIEQKISMLNCCINHQIKLSKNIETTQILESTEKGWDFLDLTIKEEKEEKEIEIVSGSDNENDNSEEFFDIEDKEEEKRKQEEEAEKNIPRRGALQRIPNVYLNDGKTPMYIPETQQLPPMTEDMILIQQEIFEALGNSPEATLERAKIQSATLFSDMQSFKAANPGCNLVDFLKWYSPRDVENDELSERMKTEDNIWQKNWQDSKPMTCYEQKQLFEHVREAELALHYLESIKFTDLMNQMLVGMFTIGYYSLKNTPLIECEPVLKSLNKLKDKMMNVCNSSVVFEKYDDLLIEFQKVELLISFAFSISCRIPDKKIISSMCSSNEVTFQNIEHIKKLISNKEKFKAPEVQEFIFRCLSSRSLHPNLAHKLYCLISSKEFRIASAISTGIPF